MQEDRLWYAMIGGREEGPVTVTELMGMVHDGAIRGDTLVRDDRSRKWKRASTVEGLLPLPPRGFVEDTLTGRVSPVPDGRDDDRNRWVRYLLWALVAFGCTALVGVWVAVILSARAERAAGPRMPPPDYRPSVTDPVTPGSEGPTPPGHEESYRTEIRRFEGHTDIVKSLAFSPDGRYLLSGGGSVGLPTAPERTDRFRLTPPKEDTPEGDADVASLLERSTDFSVRVWEVASAAQVRILREHEGMVTSLAFSPPPSRLYALSADANGNAILWDTDTWQPVQRFTGSRRSKAGLGETRVIHDVAFSVDGSRAVLAGSGYGEAEEVADFEKNAHLILWDPATGGEIYRDGDQGPPAGFFERPEFVEQFFSADYTPDGRHVVAGGSGSTAGVYWFGPDGGAHRATGPERSQTRIILRDLEDPERFRYQFEARSFGTSGHDSPSASLVITAVSPDGRKIVSADTLGRMCLWTFDPDAAEPSEVMERIFQLELSDRLIHCVNYSPDGHYFVTGGDDLILWDGKSDELEIAWELGPKAAGTFRAKSYHVHSVAFSPDGKVLAAGCDDHVIRLFKVPLFILKPTLRPKE